MCTTGFPVGCHSAVTALAYIAPMDPGLEPSRPDTFMVRVVPGAAGSLAGHIHHLRTGERRRFENVHELGTVLLEMAQGTISDPETS
jgi:hypothetical protein